MHKRWGDNYVGQMPKRASIDSAAAQGLVQELLGENELDAEFVAIMLDVFMRVCRTLEVADASDPLSDAVARTVILIASEGERDPDTLYKRSLTRFHQNS